MLSMAEHSTDHGRDDDRDFDGLDAIERGYEVRIQKITSSTDDTLVVHHESVSDRVSQTAPSSNQYTSRKQYGLGNDLTASVSTEKDVVENADAAPSLFARLAARQDMLQLALLFGIVLIALLGFVAILVMIDNSANYWIEDQEASVIQPAAGGYERLYDMSPSDVTVGYDKGSTSHNSRTALDAEDIMRDKTPQQSASDTGELMHILTGTE